MLLTSAKIQQQQFKTRFRGFDVQEVDLFLEHIALDMDKFLKENNKLKEKNKSLEFENQGYRKREESFKRIMLNTQKTIEQMKDNAKKSAELVLAEAEVRAEKLLNGAHNRLAQLYSDISELKRQRMQIEVQIRSVIDSHTKLLEIGKEESQQADEMDTTIKLFKSN
ncbi:MAG: cell division protein DivIVA [Desulfobacteraceae bacterium 4572_19]|nr:MAG: cell division protein DivIVA [Desulfobacteraceae bacterium 4572_19]